MFEISAATHEGLRELAFALAERGRSATGPPRRPPRADADRAAADAGRRRRLHRRAGPGRADGASWCAASGRERWVRQTDFANDEAVGYLADRLARLGVEEALARPGRRAGRRGHHRRRHVRLGADAGGAADALPMPARAAPTSGSSDSRPSRGRAAGAPARHAGRPTRRRELRRHPRRGGRARTGDRARRRMTGTRSRAAARLVVKVGSSSLTTAAGGLDPARLDALVDALAARRAAGTQVVLVSSGAIAAGLAPLGLPRRPRDLATQQAAASVGQLLLVERYAASFARSRPHRRAGAAHRRRPRPPRPTTATPSAPSSGCWRSASSRSSTRTTRSRPTRSGSATTTGWPRWSRTSSRADALVLLSDVDGAVRRRPPPARRRGCVPRCRGDGRPRRRADRRHPAPASAPAAWRPSSTRPGSRPAPASRSCCAAAEHVGDALAGGDVGTAFAATTRRTGGPAVLAAARDHPARPAGPGRRRGRGGRPAPDVAAAGRHHRRSGDFDAGDPVELVGPDGRAVARGLVGYDAGELPALLGRSSPRAGPGAPARGRAPRRSGAPARLSR